VEIKVVFNNEHPELIQSSQFKEDIVKNHLEIIVLSMLSDRPMSGYNLIKEIFARYNVLISQGTIYSLLYTLKDEGILQAGFRKKDLREKIYSCTQEGKQGVDERIAEYIEADEYVLNSIKKFGHDV
jgi:DNA-binding PadR family transcriptional regulator